MSSDLPFAKRKGLVTLLYCIVYIQEDFMVILKTLLAECVSPASMVNFALVPSHLLTALVPSLLLTLRKVRPYCLLH
jgi:hypothetical protein